MNGVCASAYNVIYISSDYIGNFTGDVKREFTGIVYYMIARVLQWDGQGQAPIGLLTGIADFFRLKAGYATAMWAKSGQGVRWDEGYDVTARFLEYCDGEYGGIVSFLNSKMRFGYDVEFFKEYSGMSVDELWNGYVAKYRG
ncbi:uncharacterized protein LOC109841606 [Asparagus officinalis]|nr:uncharacterized protein LOC109841606 [Asparagus officinalis]